MRKFNSKKYKGVKKGFKSFTHVEITYENCEQWVIPVKDVIIHKEGKYIQEMTVNMRRVIPNISKWPYDSVNKRVERLTKYANDIVSVRYIRLDKNNNWDIGNNTKYIEIASYLETNPYSAYCDNLLQSTHYDKENEVLEYTWIVDEDIKIDYCVNEDNDCRITIPRIYSNIIDKLDRRFWIIEEV